MSSKFNVLVAKVLQTGPVQVSTGIVPTGHLLGDWLAPFLFISGYISSLVLYFLYLSPSEFSEHSPHAATFNSILAYCPRTF